MAMIQGNVLVQGGSFNMVHSEKKTSGLQFLHEHVHHGASYDSAERFPPPRCHPETRIAILQALWNWLNGLSQILWLEGPAGSGKTALAQTFCEQLQDCQRAGSFFFSRAVVGRSSPQRLLLTIAYQLSIAIPDIQPHIEQAITADRLIVSKSLDIQLQTLIIAPLGKIKPPTRPLVVVIDGLDECEGETHQRYIIRLFGQIFLYNPQFPIRFVITSRPEPWIRAEFESEPLRCNLHHISLEQTTQANEDIRIYYQSGFADICNDPQHRFIMANVPHPWPSVNSLNNLVIRSSGQFIYAATVLKFVGDPNYQPVQRLETILDNLFKSQTLSNPFSDLDRLYLQILSTASDKKRTVEVLGTLLVMLTKGCSGITWDHSVELLDIAENLLGYQRGEGYLALRSLHSLLHIPHPSIVGQPANATSLQDHNAQQELRKTLAVRFHHKSFQDFLLDPSRSGEYFVDEASFHGRIAFACLNQVKDLPQYLLSRNHIDVQIYSILFAAAHSIRSGTPSRTLIACVGRSHLYVYWLGLLANQWPEYKEPLAKVQRLVLPMTDPYFRRLEADMSLMFERVGIKSKKSRESANLLRHAQEFANRKPTRSYLIDPFTFQLSLMSLVDWLATCSEIPFKLILQYQVLINILEDLEDDIRTQVTPVYFKGKVILHTMNWTVDKMRRR